MHKLKSLLVYSKILMFSALLLSANFAGAVVNSTQSRLVFNQDSIAESLVLINSDRAPSLVQIWSDDGDPLALPERVSTPLIIVPPVFKLEPGESRNVRVMLLSRQNMSSDRESLYWLNIYQIPPNTQGDGTVEKKVILPLRIRLKVFIRPAGLNAPKENVGSELQFNLITASDHKLLLQITNPTAYYMSLGGLSLGDKELAPMMIAPKSSATTLVPQGKNNLQLNWSVIDDLGKQTMYKRQLKL